MFHAEHALATFCKNAREWCESPSALEACSKNPANLAPPSPWFLSAGEGAFRCFRNNCFWNSQPSARRRHPWPRTVPSVSSDRLNSGPRRSLSNAVEYREQLRYLR